MFCLMDKIKLYTIISNFQYIITIPSIQSFYNDKITCNNISSFEIIVLKQASWFFYCKLTNEHISMG